MGQRFACEVAVDLIDFRLKKMKIKNLRLRGVMMMAKRSKGRAVMTKVNLLFKIRGNKRKFLKDSKWSEKTTTRKI
jgi:hypothetical protein